MNAVWISILGLLALSSFSLAIVCKDDICDGAICQDVTEEDCNGKIVPKGGFCGCCDACYAILKEGDYCGFLFFHGLPPSAECDTELECSATTRNCERIVPE